MEFLFQLDNLAGKFSLTWRGLSTAIAEGTRVKPEPSVPQHFRSSNAVSVAVATLKSVGATLADRSPRQVILKQDLTTVSLLPVPSVNDFVASNSILWEDFREILGLLAPFTSILVFLYYLFFQGLTLGKISGLRPT